MVNVVKIYEKNNTSMAGNFHVAYYVGQNVLQNQLQVMTLSCSNNILKIG